MPCLPAQLASCHPVGTKSQHSRDARRHQAAAVPRRTGAAVHETPPPFVHAQMRGRHRPALLAAVRHSHWLRVTASWIPPHALRPRASSSFHVRCWACRAPRRNQQIQQDRRGQPDGVRQFSSRVCRVNAVAPGRHRRPWTPCWSG